MSANPTEFHGDFLPQDSADDDSSIAANAAQPFSEAELEDLLYGDSRSVEERLTLLREFRDNLAARAGGDIADDDSEELIAEIDRRISELQSDETLGEAADTVDVDPLAHRETLAPDSDEMEALEDADEASLDEEDEWLDEEEEDEEEEDEEPGADYRDAVDEDFEDDEDEDGDAGEDDD
jgi:hypothetical protein